MRKLASVRRIDDIQPIPDDKVIQIKWEFFCVGQRL